MMMMDFSLATVNQNISPSLFCHEMGEQSGQFL